jgi:hypothetical protein
MVETQRTQHLSARFSGLLCFHTDSPLKACWKQAKGVVCVRPATRLNPGAIRMAKLWETGS